MILSLSKILAPEPRPPPPLSLIDLKHHMILVGNITKAQIKNNLYLMIGGTYGRIYEKSTIG